MLETNYVKIVPQTHEEKVEMLLKLDKRTLVEMLIESNNIIERLLESNR